MAMRHHLTPSLRFASSSSGFAIARSRRARVEARAVRAHSAWSFEVLSMNSMVFFLPVAEAATDGNPTCEVFP